MECESNLQQCTPPASQHVFSDPWFFMMAFSILEKDSRHVSMKIKLFNSPTIFFSCAKNDMEAPKETLSKVRGVE